MGSVAWKHPPAVVLAEPMTSPAKYISTRPDSTTPDPLTVILVEMFPLEGNTLSPGDGEQLPSLVGIGVVGTRVVATGGVWTSMVGGVVGTCVVATGLAWTTMDGGGVETCAVATAVV